MEREENHYSSFMVWNGRFQAAAYEANSPTKYMSYIEGFAVVLFDPTAFFPSACMGRLYGSATTAREKRQREK
jgi:hypothetical protein